MSRIVRKRFGHVRFVNSSQLGRCHTCSDIKTRRELAAKRLDKATVDECDIQRQQHLDLASAERALYHSKRAEALHDNQSILSLILDGSHGACLPWMRQPPSDLTAYTRLPFTVSSLIDHGHGETDLLLIMPLWKHDPNLFLSLLHHRLLKLIDTGQRLGQQTLYLQLDNCVRENKNKVVFAYLSHLVRVGGK